MNFAAVSGWLIIILALAFGCGYGAAKEWETVAGICGGCAVCAAVFVAAQASDN